MDIYIQEPEQSAKACIIWMHGLGADAENMMDIAAQLNLKFPVRHVFLNAPVRPVTLNNNMPMRAWYDIIGLQLSDREDRIGITQSMQRIDEIIREQCSEGLRSDQIYLAGFSQGGAMALYAGLHILPSVAGVISLSAYLPLVRELDTPKHINLPIFMAIGEQDQVVWPDWTNYAYNWLIEQNFTQVTLHKYSMEHTVCMSELRDLTNWLNIKMEEIV